jgi:hypothetical protein
MSTLKVGTIQDHANSITAISIDSAGRVTQPAKPAFAVRNARSSSYRGNNLFGGSDTTVIFDIGSNFATSGTNDGGFVAPVAGVYCFSFMGFTSNSGQNNASGGFYVQLSKNGSQVGHKVYGYSVSADYNRFDNTQLLQCAAGDVIKVDVPGSDNYVWGGAGDLSRATQFQGHLVG